MEKSWSGMRKYLEKEMLAECLRGRVRYNCTTYPSMDNNKIFEVFIDDCCVKQFSWETVNSYFIHTGLSQKGDHTHPMDSKDYWEGFWETLNNTPMEQRTEYTQDEFCDALASYRNAPIAESLNNPDAIVRMFAILDRRVGKRTLAALPAVDQITPQWLQSFYRLRIHAEK